MHIEERSARTEEIRENEGWKNRDFIASWLSGALTGYGVGVWGIARVMAALFIISTLFYIGVGVREPWTENIVYSILAFTVAPPPPLPSGLGTQLVVGVETFFGTLSIVLLGYILGNREQF